jgi:hypothetical protein
MIPFINQIKKRKKWNKIVKIALKRPFYGLFKRYFSYFCSQITIKQQQKINSNDAYSHRNEEPSPHQRDCVYLDVAASKS